MNTARVTCWFTGSVQGVGFRWRTQRLLAKSTLEGYVRNLPDGRVELVLQGARIDVENAIELVAHELSSHIDRVEREDGEHWPDLGAFRIER